MDEGEPEVESAWFLSHGGLDGRESGKIRAVYVYGHGAWSMEHGVKTGDMLHGC